MQSKVSYFDPPPGAEPDAPTGTGMAGTPAWHWLARRFGMKNLIVGFCLTLIGIIWSAVIVHGNFQQQEMIDNAIRQNSNLAMAFEEHTVRTIKGADAALLFLRREYARLGARIDIAKYVADGTIDSRLFIYLNVFDEHGISVARSHALKPATVADREYFSVHVGMDSGDLYIAKPVLGRVSQKWTIQLTRRINKPDGSFGGIVSVGVDPEYFLGFYRQADLGKDSMVQLVGLDGVVRVRQTGLEASFGHDSLNNGLLSEQAQHPAGSFLTSGRLEQIPRYTSYRTVPDYPLVVAVGTSRAELLAAFSIYSKSYFAFALLMSVVIACFGALLVAAVARQKRAMNALAASETQFRATFNYAGMGIAHDGPDGRFAQVNQKLCDMLGYSRDELRGMTISDITHPQDKGVLQEQRDRLVAGEIPAFSVERRCVHKDGSVILTNRTVTLVRDTAGKPLYFIRLIEDITERRQAEERYRATFEQAAVGIAHTGLDRRFLQVNQKFCEMLGYTRDEMLTMCTNQIAHPDEQERRVETRRALAGEIDTYSGEKRYIRKDGAMLWVNRTVSMARDSAGNPRYFIRVVEDISKRRQLQDDLERLAHYDSLTSLPNRELIRDRLVHALEQARRRARIVGVMFIDLDRFKIVNDTLGHGVGDQLLRLVSARLAKCVRGEDTVGRLGGDEFAIILTEIADKECAALVAQKIIAALTAPFDLEGREVFVTASIGIATYPDDAETAPILIQNADVAMYHAKMQGKNNYQFYTAAMNQQAAAKMQMENDLRYAIQREEFVLHYQPKANLHTGRITGVEALLRWQHADGRLVPPAEFIPVLEESGLIVPVGEWVLRAACAQVRAWQEAGCAPTAIAVNLSAKQFHQHDICATVMRALREHDVGAHLLELEITESAAMHNEEATTTTLQKLKAIGVSIAIDDFGTGYSSLGYLKRFPIDSLKIDRSFVTGLPDDQDDASIAQAVITVAHALRLKVVAEGVENELQLEFLAANTCDEMQGYYFSRPLTAVQCTQLLKEQRRLPLRPGNNGQRELPMLQSV